MTYTLFYTAPEISDDGTPTGTYEVRSVQYANIEDEHPIPGTTATFVSGNLTQTEADTKAGSLQRASYAETRKAAQDAQAQG